MARNAVSCGHDDTGKAFRLRPLSGSRTATTGIGRVAGSVAGRSVWLGLAVHSGFAVVMAQVRRPVPFRTRKLRPGTAMVLHSRGCGRVARRRIQLSGPSGRVPCGIPGRSLFLYSLGGSRRAQRPGNPHFFVSPASRPEHVARGAGRLVLFPGPPILFVLLCRPAGRSPSPGGRKAFPVPGRLGLFRASKGNFCYSTKTSGEQIFFRNVLLTRYMIRFSEYGLWNGIGKDGNDVPEHRSAACTM